MKIYSKKNVMITFISVYVILLILEISGFYSGLYNADYIELSEPSDDGATAAANLFVLGFDLFYFTIIVLFNFAVNLVLSIAAAVILRLVFRTRFCPDYLEVFKNLSIFLWISSAVVYIASLILTKFDLPITAAFMIIPFPTMAQLIFLLGFRNKNKLTEQQLIAEQSGNMTFYGQEGNM